MTITFIGSGNVATHLAEACTHAGFTIKQIWSRSIEHANEITKKFGGVAIDNYADVLPADVFIVSINDDGIAQLPMNLPIGESLIVHTSGATHLSVFEGRFINYGVLYPLQTFSKSRTVDFREVPLCIEANNAANYELVNDLAKKLSDVVHSVDSNSRSVLHLAAVFVCNFTNYLYASGEQLLEEQKIDFNLLRPLIMETAKKVQIMSPALAQTGPAVRGDEQTILRHLQMLDDHPQLWKMYALISAAIKTTSI